MPIALIVLKYVMVVTHVHCETVLESKTDKYATWCPHVENHLTGIEEEANACITL